jgi:nitrite reductase/ring-hydroxylating ferredoxin subunit
MPDATGYDPAAGKPPGPHPDRAAPRRLPLSVRTDLPGYVAGDDPHARLDIRVDSPGREGLAGTTPSNVYKPLPDGETITVPPDWRPMEDQPAWRRDFPIDWPQDHYVARRDFAKFMVLTCFAFFVGQVWIGLQNWWRRAGGQPEIRRIASLSELPVGGVLVFHYPEEHDKCLLIRTGPDRLLAYSQQCTHLSCAVVPQLEVDATTGLAEGIIHCPCHEGYFDLETGRVVAGPPPRPLPRILLEVRGQDIYATGIDWRTS